LGKKREKKKWQLKLSLPDRNGQRGEEKEKGGTLTTKTGTKREKEKGTVEAGPPASVPQGKQVAVGERSKKGGRKELSIDERLRGTGGEKKREKGRDRLWARPGGKKGGEKAAFAPGRWRGEGGNGKPAPPAKEKKVVS